MKLALVKELEMQADCQKYIDTALKAHIYLTAQKYQKIPRLWKEIGYPDLKAWPGLYDLCIHLFLNSYLIVV